MAVINQFGYLQLDTVSIAGARSHVIVLLSRLEGFERELGEQLLLPGEPLFEYWGHEASWIPLELYPAFAFRRREFKKHPWWGDVVRQHPELARKLLSRIRAGGGLRSIELEGAASKGWWQLSLAKRVITALWSSGQLAIRERNNFQRCFDLPDRVIPEEVRNVRLSEPRAMELLLLKALDGHGFAATNTLAATWRLRNCRDQIAAALVRLERRGEVSACELRVPSKRPQRGWIRPRDLELTERLKRVRPRGDRGVCLSPFDPLLWDRQRVRLLFNFDQLLEIYKPAPERKYGYFCLPVLAGEHLVARLDLKANRKQGCLNVLSVRFEGTGSRKPLNPTDEQAARTALKRFSEAVQLEPSGW